jgi:hypothetical protein
MIQARSTFSAQCVKRGCFSRFKKAKEAKVWPHTWERKKCWDALNCTYEIGQEIEEIGNSQHQRVTRTARTTQRKYFDYFTFNTVDYSVNCGLIRSGARHRALTQTIGNARGLDINSPRSAENYHQDLRFRRHQQHDDPNSVRGLDNNFASDRDCDSTIITWLRHHQLCRADHAAPDKS